MAERDILIIGGGRFGLLAAGRLRKRVIAVVEPEPSPELIGFGVELIRAEGVAAMAGALEDARPPKWIVPCAPTHLVLDWLIKSLEGRGARAIEAPESHLPQVAVHMRGANGEHYLSMADFICPDDCPEPVGACTVTGEPRKAHLYEMLAQKCPEGWKSSVIRSHQLAPGVGGVKSADLLGLRDEVGAWPGRWIIATSCRCHAVVHGLEFK